MVQLLKSTAPIKLENLWYSGKNVSLGDKLTRDQISTALPLVRWATFHRFLTSLCFNFLLIKRAKSYSSYRVIVKISGPNSD